MILAVDIGNTSTKFGLFEGETLASKFSIPTIRDSEVSELKRAIDGRLEAEIDKAIVCSVVPDSNAPLREFLSSSAWVEPIFVNNNFDFGLKISYRPLESLGTDRLVNAYSAVKTQGAPCIVCSLGTATTIDVVSADREFLGGIIAPGLDAISDALHANAPLLPIVDSEKPDALLGNSTVDAIRSGLYHGYVAMIEGLITRVRTESAVSRVVATGGNASRLANELAGMITVEENLLLKGLRRLASNP